MNTSFLFITYYILLEGWDGMTFGDRLKKLRKGKGLTLADLEDRFDRGRTAFSNYENNHRKPNMNLVRDLADFFEVSVDFLLGREEEVKEEPEKIKLVPIFDMTNGQALLVQDNIIGHKKVPEKDLEGGEYFYLRINGDDSMINAGIGDSDLIFVKKQGEIKDGDIALVKFEDKVILRYLYSTDNQYILETANPKYKLKFLNHGEVEIIGKAIEVIRRL